MRQVTSEINQKPTPASFVVAANMVEVSPNGTKEFNFRFITYCEGQQFCCYLFIVVSVSLRTVNHMKLHIVVIYVRMLTCSVRFLRYKRNRFSFNRRGFQRNY
jgi:hypothetical protein